MKRLVVSGFACPPEAWEKYFGPETRVISFYDVLAATQSSDVLKWSRYLNQELDKDLPEHIICHDYGGPICLLALWARERKSKSQPAKVTILNTALKDFDVFKNPHPLRIQTADWKSLRKAVGAAGGETDERLKPYFSRVKATYRRIIVFSLLRKVTHLFGIRRNLNIKLKSNVLLIASPSDPFIALTTMEHIRLDLNSPPMEVIDYGHFPYSSPNAARVRDLISAHELAPKVSSRQTQAKDASEILREANPVFS